MCICTCAVRLQELCQTFAFPNELAVKYGLQRCASCLQLHQSCICKDKYDLGTVADNHSSSMATQATPNTLKGILFPIQPTWCMFVSFGEVGKPTGSEHPITVRSSFCQYFNCCREEAQCILSSSIQSTSSRKLQPIQYSTALHRPLQVD